MYFIKLTSTAACCCVLQHVLQQGRSRSSTQEQLARCMLGDRADQMNRDQKKKTFKPLKIKQRDEPWHWLHTVPIQFALFPVTCPCHQQGSHWGPCWRHLRSLGPLSRHSPLKSCTEMRLALMFALYPTCKAIIIHASWQSQAQSLLHLQLFALGYDMTTVDLFSFTYRSLCLSFSLLFSTQHCVPYLNPALIWRLGKSFTSRPVWHLLLSSVLQFSTTFTTVWLKYVHTQVCIVQCCSVYISAHLKVKQLTQFLFKNYRRVVCLKWWEMYWARIWAAQRNTNKKTWN